MQQVSNAWKAAQQQTIVPQSYLSITCNISDRTAQGSGVITAPSEGFCSPTQVLSQTQKNFDTYANLELNAWVLDGSLSYLPTSTAAVDTGYVSSVLSGDDCLFAQNPVIRLQWQSSNLQPIPGVTITWSKELGQMARDFILTFWRGSNRIAQKKVVNNTQAVTVVELEVEEYDALTIEVVEWCLPRCRVHITDILMGISTTWADDDILDYNFEQNVDLLSAALPQDEIRFTIDNVRQQFNPDAARGYSKFMMEQQQVQVRYGLKTGSQVEWIDGGTFYLTEWDTPQNGISVQFAARNIFEFMQERYTGILSGTLLEIAQAALGQASLPDNFSVELSETLGNYPVDITEKYDYTIAETLQMIANAALCVLFQDRQGKLHLKPFALVPTDYHINSSNSYERGEYSIAKPISKVVVCNGLAEKDVYGIGEVMKLDNPFIQAADHAAQVADWAVELCKLRKNIKGSYRADPRCDTLDMSLVQNKYTQNTTVLTGLSFHYNGTFSGNYAGRVFFTNGTNEIYLGECFAGEVV